MTMQDPALEATDFQLRQGEASSCNPLGAVPAEVAESRRARRSHTPAFKASIAVAALQGEASVADLSQRFGVHRNQIAQWRSQLLERAPELFHATLERPRRK